MLTGSNKHVRWTSLVYLCARPFKMLKWAERFWNLTRTVCNTKKNRLHIFVLYPQSFDPHRVNRGTPNWYQFVVQHSGQVISDKSMCNYFWVSREKLWPDWTELISVGCSWMRKKKRHYVGRNQIELLNY